MRWKLPHIFFNIIFFFNFTFVYGIETKIIAMVNNEPITTYELKNKIITTLVLSNQNINQEIIDRSKRAAMNSLINYKLVNELYVFKNDKILKKKGSNNSTSKYLKFLKLEKKIKINLNDDILYHKEF